MAWYDTGTVAVTNGSTIVTGTGTNFIVGAQVGEAFYGPDSKLYEIQTITSATVMVLADAYLGSTQSGQTYQIVPTQSLVADLAVSVTDLISDFADVRDYAGNGKFNDGAVGTPGITFTQDQDNGLYRIGANNWALAAGGQKIVDVSTSGIDVTGSVSTDTLDVTGTATMDGLVVDGVAKVLGTAGNTFIIADATETNGYQLKANTSASADFGFLIENLAGKDLLKVESNNDISFYEDTGTTAKLFWDASAESLGIGTSSPTDLLNISGSSNQIGLDTGDQATYGTLDIGHFINGAFIGTQAGSNAASNILRLGTSGSERMRIDSAGNLLVGGTVAGNAGTVSLSVGNVGSTNGGLQLWGTTTGTHYIQFGDESGTAANHYRGYMAYSHNVDSLTLGTASTERMRIDSAGRVLIGITGASGFASLESNDLAITGQCILARTSGSVLVGTTTPLGNSGTTIDSSGYIYASNDNAALYLNRQGVDGTIAEFRKDGATVGSIGSASGVVSYIVLDPRTGVKGAGLLGSSADANTGILQPTDNSGSPADAAIQLGTASTRFKDLYLSGNVQMGGNLDVVGQLGAYNNSSSSWGSMNFRATDYIFKNSGGTEKMRIDSAGNVGIGAVPSTLWSASYDALQIGLGGSIAAHGAAGHALKIGSNFVYEGLAPNYYDKYLTTATAGKYEQDNDGHKWSTAASGTAGGVISWQERMRIDSAGNVGIGCSPNARFSIGISGTQTAPVFILGNDADTGLFRPADNTLAVTTAGTERMRIDSAGNLLVGTTDILPANNNVAGIALSAGTYGGRLEASRSGGAPCSFNRVDSNGSIIEIRQAGIDVGSIGTNGGDLYFADSSYGGIKPLGDGYAIVPCTNSGADYDDAMQLGHPDFRWKNLYLSGGVYLGGTGAANKLDDYEEGTWTPVLGNGATATNMTGIYTKVGRLVTVTLSLENSTITGAPNHIITGLPFANGSKRSSLAVTYLNTFNVACETVGGIVQGLTSQLEFLGMKQGASWVVASPTAGSARYLHVTASYHTA